MKKILAVAVCIAAIVTMAVSFGVSTTGLFHAPVLLDDQTSEDKKARWELLGNVSVRLGGVSRLIS